MRILKGDQVKLIAGKHKGVTGAVLEVDSKRNRLKVAKVNMVRYHKKPTQDNPDGGVIEKEGFIDASNVMLLIKEGKKEMVTRIRISHDPKNPKKKIRIATKTNKEV